MQYFTLNSWNGKDLFLFQIAYCSVSIIYRISLGLLIISLINENSYFYYTILLTINGFMLLIFVATIIDGYRTEHFKGIFLEYVFGFMDQHQKNTLFLNFLIIIIGIRLLAYKFENILLISIIVYTGPTFNPYIYTTLMLGSLLSSFIYTLSFEERKEISEYFLKVLKYSAMDNLLQGYFLMCHRSQYFYFYDYLLFFIFCLLSCSNQLKNKILLKLGYKNDILNPYLQEFIPFNIIYQQNGLHNELIENNDGTYNQKEEVNNFLAGIQVLHVINMILFNTFIVQIDLDFIYQGILMAYFIFLSYYFSKTLAWTIDYIIFGPFHRNIKIDCQQIQNLSKEQINQQYFKFRKVSTGIYVSFINLNPKVFEKAFSYILLSNVLQNLELSDEFYQNHQQFFILQERNKVIYLQLRDKYQIAEIIFKNIVQNKLYDYDIVLDRNYNDNIIYKLLPKYYEILPNLDIFRSNIRNNTIYFIKNEIMRLIIFKKLIYKYMIFHPDQVYYDLHDN